MESGEQAHIFHMTIYMNGLGHLTKMANHTNIFSSPESKAHKVSLWDSHGPTSIRPSSVHISKIFSETAWPINAKLHVEHP